MVTFSDMDRCNTWSEMSYGNKFNCFEFFDDDGFKYYGQFFAMKYETLKECSKASKRIYGENNCYENYHTEIYKPVARPDNFKGDEFSDLQATREIIKSYE